MGPDAYPCVLRWSWSPGPRVTPRDGASPIPGLPCESRQITHDGYDCPLPLSRNMLRVRCMNVPIP